MGRRGHWIQHLADEADLYGEPVPGVPVVEVAGDRRVIVERHGGVIEYGSEQIRIQVSYGELCIRGCDLELTRMTRHQLIISGQIDCIQLQRRCR